MSRLTSPPDPIVFDRQVWGVVCRIPAGRVASYGQIARLIPAPEGMDWKSYLAFGPRWVGSAMARCPDDVPWQRVINARGEISVRPGAEHQRRLLEAEGVVFDARGRVDLARCGWQGSDPDSEQAPTRTNA
jgi:methylated-DNA-protein-cysteine methyltransferase related protein